jgi:lysozyme family protein
MREKFEKAMKFVRVAEGGYFNHPNDPGGETMYGITKRDYPNLDIKNLSREKADDIFFEDYWSLSSAEKLPEPVYISYFDSVVNTGRKQANKFLQRALGVVADGIVGPVTLESVEKADAKELAAKIVDQRQTFYENLSVNKPKLKVFLKGWTNRNTNLKHFITNIAA